MGALVRNGLIPVFKRKLTHSVNDSDILSEVQINYPLSSWGWTLVQNS